VKDFHFCIWQTWDARTVSNTMERNQRIEVIMGWSPCSSFGQRWTFFYVHNCFRRFLSHCNVQKRIQLRFFLIIFNYCTRWDLSSSKFYDTPCYCFLTMSSNAASMLHINTALKNGIYSRPNNHQIREFLFLTSIIFSSVFTTFKLILKLIIFFFLFKVMYFYKIILVKWLQQWYIYYFS